MAPLYIQYNNTHDVIPTSHRPGVVYQVPCFDCDKLYTGETGKTLARRMKQHEGGKENASSEIVQHARDTTHNINYKGAKVVGQNQEGGPGGKRWAMEGLFSMLAGNNCMNDIGKTMPMSQEYEQLFP